MAKGFDVLHVKSAIKSRNKFDLSRTHLTTMNFGQIVPLFVEETVPGDKISVDSNYFSRMAPLAVPTYGKFRFNVVNAFVPYHQIAEDADAWIAGKTAWEGLTPLHRYFTVGTLFNFIQNNCITSIGATVSNCDIQWINSNGSTGVGLFTPIGKYYIKVLTALGYTIPSSVDLQTSSSWYTVVKETHLSAYPLLAFAKVYNDYMSQSTRFNTSVLSNFLKAIQYNQTVTGYNTSTGALGVAGIAVLLSNIRLQYDNDYFISAWAFPNAPIVGSDTISTIQVPYDKLGNYVGIRSTDDNVEISSPGSTGGYSSYLSQRALDFLKSFDDWVRRNNYSGSRAVQQIYSRFGIKTDDYRTHYAHIISTDSMPIQVGDVTATAATQVSGNDVPLGDYAGKGIMNGSKGFSVQADDFGIVLSLGYFTVVPMNPFGYDRRVLRSTPLDYYNPEFDGLGADAISVGEFFGNPTQDPSSDSMSDVMVYGFTERYNAYRFGRDVVTGEFRDYHQGDMSSWHSARDLTAVRNAGNLVAQTSTVNSVDNVSSQYDRIFANTAADIDKFYLTCQFKVDAVRPMLNLNQVVKLGEGDTAVPRNGNVIS